MNTKKTEKPFVTVQSISSFSLRMPVTTVLKSVCRMASWQKKKLVQNLHKLLTTEKPINIIQDKNYQSIVFVVGQTKFFPILFWTSRMLPILLRRKIRECS